MVSAALPNFTAIKNRVLTALRDDEEAFITAQNILDYVNDGYLDLNARLRLKQVELDGTTDSDGLIALPDEFIEPLSLWLADSVRVNFVDDAVFESHSYAGSALFVVVARIYNGNIETYPAQDEVDYTLRYVARPTLLADGADKPVELTPELCQRLVYYAISEAKLKESELKEYQFYRAQYEDGLPGRTRAMGITNPGPYTLIPAEGPFGL